MNGLLEEHILTILQLESTKYVQKDLVQLMKFLQVNLLFLRCTILEVLRVIKAQFVH